MPLDENLKDRMALKPRQKTTKNSLISTKGQNITQENVPLKKVFFTSKVLPYIWMGSSYKAPIKGIAQRESARHRLPGESLSMQC